MTSSRHDWKFFECFWSDMWLDNLVSRRKPIPNSFIKLIVGSWKKYKFKVHFNKKLQCELFGYATPKFLQFHLCYRQFIRLTAWKTSSLLATHGHTSSFVLPLRFCCYLLVSQRFMVRKYLCPFLGRKVHGAGDFVKTCKGLHFFTNVVKVNRR